MKKRARSALRDLVSRVGLAEAARRTGRSEKTIAKAARGKASAALAADARKAWKRSERARKAHETREREERAQARKRSKRLRESRLPVELVAKAGGVEKIAKVAKVTKRTAKKWIEIGGAPKTVLDAAKQLRSSGRAYRLEWKSGRDGLGSVSKEEYEKLRGLITRFVDAANSSADHDEIDRKYRNMARVKKSLRRRLTKGAFSELIDDIAADLGLPDTGAFSAERFKKS